MATILTPSYEIRPDIAGTRWYDETLRTVSPRFTPLAVHGVHMLREAVHIAARVSGEAAPNIESQPLFVPSRGNGYRHLNPEIRDVTDGNKAAAAYTEYAAGILAMADGASAISQHNEAKRIMGRPQTHLVVSPMHTDKVEGLLRFSTEGGLLQTAAPIESMTVGWTRKGGGIAESFAPHVQISARQHADDPTYTTPLVSVDVWAKTDGGRGFVQADVIDVLYDLPYVRPEASPQLLIGMGRAATTAALPWNVV
jgi:hypothetical protein